MFHLQQRLQRIGITLAFAALVPAIAPTAVAAPSRAAGKAISGLCAACHGADGISVDSHYPNLAGQNYRYLVKALEQFKTGQRPSSIMHGIAGPLSTGQIENLAAYYASRRGAYCSGR